jgi:thioredoxin 1
MLELNESNFQAEVLESDIPVLVDFWGPACAPCRILAPVLEALADENAGKLKIAKVNVSEAFAIAAKYQIQVMPTMLFFKAGAVVRSLSGAQPKDALQKIIDEVVA